MTQPQFVIAAGIVLSWIGVAFSLAGLLLTVAIGPSLKP